LVTGGLIPSGADRGEVRQIGGSNLGKKEQKVSRLRERAQNKLGSCADLLGSRARLSSISECRGMGSSRSSQEMCLLFRYLRYTTADTAFQNAF